MTELTLKALLTQRATRREREAAEEILRLRWCLEEIRNSDTDYARQVFLVLALEKLKFCHGCKEELPIEDFTLFKDGPNIRRRGRCRACYRKYWAAFAQAKRDRESNNWEYGTPKRARGQK